MDEKPTVKKMGFTSIELVLLVAIIILLVIITLPHSRPRTKSKTTTAKADIALIGTAIAIYQIHMEGYFGNYSGIIGDIDLPDPVYIGLISPNDTLKAQQNFKDWHGPYIKDIPKDPWGEYYCYTNNKADIDGTNKQVGVLTGDEVPDLPYFIYSKGKDRLTGLGNNTDDITSCRKP